MCINSPLKYLGSLFDTLKVLPFLSFTIISPNISETNSPLKYLGSSTDTLKILPSSSITLRVFFK